MNPSVSSGRVSSIAGKCAAAMISGAPPPTNEKSSTVMLKSVPAWN